VDLINGEEQMEHGYVLHLKKMGVNNPVQLKKVLEVFDHIQAEFNKAQSDDKKSR
jgi:catalase (peroxidase I)